MREWHFFLPTGVVPLPPLANRSGSVRVFLEEMPRLMLTGFGTRLSNTRLLLINTGSPASWSELWTGNIKG